MIIPSLSTIVTNLPPIAPGVGGAALTLIQSGVTLSSFSLETNPLTRAQYSKFVKFEDNEKKNYMINSRDGMTIIYLPALIVSATIFVLSNDVSFLPQQTLAGKFIVIHFLKRILEVFFLHKYSGKVSRGLSTTIGIYYAVASTLILFVANPVYTNDFTTVLGKGLFLIGMVGNFYHHKILASLRNLDSEKKEKMYVAPRGGLFDFAAAPHYMFELLGWLGIAVAANHLNAYLVFTSMTSYLAGRAVSQNEWNRAKFSEKDWPPTRKNMIPFIF